MSDNNYPNRRRADMALIITIVIGLLLGYMIKRVHIGLILGLVIGLTASYLLRRRR
jgi:F0F1-type ATP synthase assembly protein I